MMNMQLCIDFLENLILIEKKRLLLNIITLLIFTCLYNFLVLQGHLSSVQFFITENFKHIHD